MLYDEFNSYKDFTGVDVFKNKAIEKVDVMKNINPIFSVREYQKEAMGRFYYYCEEYHKKQKPIHLMFNMATGSGKTLIMASNILYFYQKGYRNFIFFTRLGNIIQKTKANFLDSNSKKYLFADKIVLDGHEVQINEVNNFEGVNEEEINIIFSTTALLHSRFNFARENVLTYGDFEDKKIVLIADEAHNLSAETNNKLSKTEEEDRRNWENTVVKILNANSQNENVLLEFTATARLEQEYPDILEKYKDKAIFRYDLKEYRLDGFSKDVRTIQINAPIMERTLSAVIISQYRRKVAEKYKIALKPVIMFKANRVTAPQQKTELMGDNPQIVVSSEFKIAFHKLIAGLNEGLLKQQSQIQDATLQKAFHFFSNQKISSQDLIEEIKSDFAPEKCLTVDEEKDLEQKQVLLNTLEDNNNEIRAIFATEKLNEGWDVLNLFDIVRLYNSRDAKSNKPGRTTVQEAQLIGRGARYYPFTINEFIDPYKRKFDTDTQNELRILEQLYYHSVTNPRYIQELENVLVREGIIPSHIVLKEIKVKNDFKENDFWKNGYIFLNSRKENLGKSIFSLNDVEVNFDFRAEWNIFKLLTGDVIEGDLFTGEQIETKKEKPEVREFKLLEFGQNIIRNAIDRIPAFRFNLLIKTLGNLQSIEEFIQSKDYLGEINVKVEGKKEDLENITQKQKLNIVFFVLSKISQDLNKHKKEFYGDKIFKAYKVSDVFYDKKLQLDGDSFRAQNMHDFDFTAKKWFAQNEIWGTSEEEAFMKFMDLVVDRLEKKYSAISLLRNEQHFKIYSFGEGLAFSPDFVLFLKEKKSKKEILLQAFIEPKGDQFLDSNMEFEKSQEGWKQKFLLEIEERNITDFENFKIENKDFKLLGLPFFNTGQREKFEEAFNKLMND